MTDEWSERRLVVEHDREKYTDEDSDLYLTNHHHRTQEKDRQSSEFTRDSELLFLKSRINIRKQDKEGEYRSDKDDHARCELHRIAEID